MYVGDDKEEKLSPKQAAMCFILCLFTFFTIPVIMLVVAENTPQELKPFDCTDPSIHLSSHGDTVNSGVLVICVFVTPLLLIIWVHLDRFKTGDVIETAKSVLVNYIFGAFFMLFTTLAIVMLSKALLVKFRPDFIEKCFSRSNVTCEDIKKTIDKHGDGDGDNSTTMSFEVQQN